MKKKVSVLDDIRAKVLAVSFNRSVIKGPQTTHTTLSQNEANNVCCTEVDFTTEDEGAHRSYAMHVTDNSSPYLEVVNQDNCGLYLDVVDSCNDNNDDDNSMSCGTIYNVSYLHSV